MTKKHKKKMMLLGYLLILNGIFVPSIIMLFGGYFIENKNYTLLPILVALLWISTLGRINAKKIIKLKQEIDAKK